MNLKAVVAAVACIHVSGCAILQTLPGSDLRPGDSVDVRLADGRQEPLVVTRASPEEICGDSRCFAASEVKWVVRRDDRMVPKVLATAALIALGILLYHGLSAAGAAAAYGSAFR